MENGEWQSGRCTFWLTRRDVCLAGSSTYDERFVHANDDAESHVAAEEGVPTEQPEGKQESCVVRFIQGSMP